MIKTKGLPKKSKAKAESGDKPPLFRYLDDLSNDKKNLMGSELSPKDYDAYQVNRAFSLYSDTIMLANMMNGVHAAPARWQHDFYLNTIRPRKRYTKWPKAIPHSEDHLLIKEYYKYNDERTKEALSILSREHIDEIKKKLEKGGIT